MVNAVSLQCSGAQATLVQEQPYVSEHFHGEESTVNEVMTIYIRYGRGIFYSLIICIFGGQKSW